MLFWFEMPVKREIFRISKKPHPNPSPRERELELGTLQTNSFLNKHTSPLSSTFPPLLGFFKKSERSSRGGLYSTIRSLHN